jgi:hypothetical protein
MTSAPGNLALKDTPLFVMLTFGTLLLCMRSSSRLTSLLDDAVTERAYDEYYKPLLSGMPNNPNGCPASATFYVSHQWTNYRVVQQLYQDG